MPLDGQALKRGGIGNCVRLSPGARPHGLRAPQYRLARAGRMRNPAPELAGIALTRSNVAALAAFLRALNEDYE